MATAMFYYEHVLLHDKLKSRTTTEKGSKDMYDYCHVLLRTCTTTRPAIVTYFY